MPTTSNRLGIAKPIVTDDFDTAEISANWQIVDDHPGIYICTSSTRPTWGANQDGMLIFETDTQLAYRWDNGAGSFLRLAPTGHLGGATQTSTHTNTTGVLTSAVSVSVSVPTNAARVHVVATWSEITGDDAEVAIREGGSTKLLRDVAASKQGSIEAYFAPSGSGSITYSLELATGGSTTSLVASASKPLTIDVTEV